jgi:bifunctional DNA-binding transcriptional regulator/antitoxin component of YhaV-PrlF toxin-antitoxin module
MVRACAHERENSGRNLVDQQPVWANVAFAMMPPTSFQVLSGLSPLTARSRRPTIKAKPDFNVLPPMTVTVKSKTPLVVPPSIRRKAGLKSGQEIEFQVVGGVISIRPRLPHDEYTPEQRRIVDAELAEGLADAKAGRVRGPFSTHKEFIASLHKEARKLNRKKAKRSA